MAAVVIPATVLGIGWMVKDAIVKIKKADQESQIFEYEMETPGGFKHKFKVQGRQAVQVMHDLLEILMKFQIKLESGQSFRAEITH